VLRKQIRNASYQQLRLELAQAGRYEEKRARDQARKIALQKVINLGARAKDAKEILDIFMDGVADDTLSKLATASNPDNLLYIRMYYKACLDLEKEFDRLIKEAATKENTLEDLVKEKKGEK